MNSAEKKIYHIITISFQFLGLIPLAYLRKLGRLIGRLSFLINKRYRAITIENLTYAFGREKGPDEIRGIACQVFENLMQIPLEMTLIPRLQRNKLKSLIKLKGLHHLDTAYQKGRGVLVLTGHIGNWELIPAVVSLLGYPISIVARPLNFEPLDIFVSKLRTWHGGSIIPKKSSMRTILHSLKQGNVVGVLLDQNANRRDGVFVDYFGLPASTTKGFALLALKTKAPIVPMFLVRTNAHYKMWSMREVPLTESGDKTKDIEVNTQVYTKIIESAVRQYPEQWFWVHRRWKTRPCQRQPGK
jgi:KDO2-lipid IV(A) lauroyltransferase